MQFNRLFRPLQKTSSLSEADIIRLQQQYARSVLWSNRNSQQLGRICPTDVPQSLVPTAQVAQLQLFNFWHSQIITKAKLLLPKQSAVE